MKADALLVLSVSIPGAFKSVTRLNKLISPGEHPSLCGLVPCLFENSGLLNQQWITSYEHDSSTDVLIDQLLCTEFG